MPAKVTSGDPNQAGIRDIGRLLVRSLVAGFLLSNLAVRAHALHVTSDAQWAVDLALAGSAIAAVVCLLRSAWVAPLMGLFAGSSLLFGFHSYRVSSQVFEFALTMLCLVLLLRVKRVPDAGVAPERRVVGVLVAGYALVAACSLLLLPVRVLEHRLFLEGSDFGRALLGAFPKDPLYLIASANRLWLFVLAGGLLVAQADARALCRQLVRGFAFAAIAAAALGLLDFGGALSLDRYNLAHLFYGARYRRLQSTFGNPSWFACFVACALPFVWLEFRQAGGRARMALAAAFPLCAASLFLSGARAAWLLALLLGASLLVIALVARRGGRPLPSPDGSTWAALAATLAAIALLASFAAMTPAGAVPAAETVPPGRFEGLSRELQLRGLGLTSPRRVAAAYALELARLEPLLGLGHESFNMHLRAQLEIPGSGVSRVVNTALAEDASERVFDDSHNTYLQVLTGTGALGLALWLAQALAALWLTVRLIQRECSPELVAVFLGLVAFHSYGLFQGMAYIPVIFFIFPVLTAYAVTLMSERDVIPRIGRSWPWRVAFVLGVFSVAAGYAADSGYANLKRRFGIAAYLPDEAVEFEGFYRSETGPAGEFRWMARRGIINVRRGQRFTLRFACEHADAVAEPVVLRLSFEGRDAGQVVFSRPGAVVERRFDFGNPGVLRLTVSRTFRPANGDRRELGVAVGAIRWE